MILVKLALIIFFLLVALFILGAGATLIAVLFYVYQDKDKDYKDNLE